MSPELQIHYDSGGDWAALYQDGNLVTVGDAYVAEEKALAACGVVVVHDDAFMRGQRERAGVAQTVAEVDAYREEREVRHAEAARLRANADALLAQADALSADA